MTWDY
jgi:hypothetical protein